MYEKFIEARSITKVVSFLNDQGYKTKAWTSSTGRIYHGQAFTKKAVRHILTNPIYKGCISHKGHVYEGEHEAIIDNEMWGSVQAIFTTNAHIRARESASRASSVLLRGIIHCTHCNASMIPTYTQKNNQRYHYYICSAKYRGIRRDCPLRSISGSIVENMVTVHIRRFLKSPEMVARVCGQTAMELNDAAVIQHMHNIDDFWQELFPAEQQRIIQLLVEGVYLKVDGVEVKMQAEGLMGLMNELENGEEEIAQIADLEQVQIFAEVT